MMNVAHLSQSVHIFNSKYYELGVLCLSSVANFLMLLALCNPHFTRGANEVSEFMKNSSA